MDPKLQKAVDETLQNISKDETYITVKALKSNEYGRTEIVRHIASDELFVRKYITVSQISDSGRRKVHEILMGAELPQVAKVIDSFQYADELVVILEYIEGISLYEYVARAHPLPKAVLDSLILDISDGMNALHNFSGGIIVHRDVTPGNIIVYEEGMGRPRAKIIDFGVARLFDGAKINDTQYLGTVGFAAPEQYGFGQTSERSDVYSLGAVIYYCLTSTNPKNNLIDIIDLDLEIPQGLKSIIRKAMALDPMERYGSVRELRDAVLGEQPSLPVTALRGAAAERFFVKPIWHGLQKVESLRILWNIFLGTLYLLTVYVVFLDPSAISGHIKNPGAFFQDISMLVFLVTPSVFLALDIFGFYKRIRILQRYSWVTIFVSTSLLSFVLTLIFVGIFS